MGVRSKLFFLSSMRAGDLAPKIQAGVAVAAIGKPVRKTRSRKSPMALAISALHL
jgi:hypothetical protein